MARIPLPFVFAVAVFFFSLTLSDARIPANIPEIEAISSELPSSLHESVANPVILLPSDSQSHSNEPIKEAQESETLSTVQPLPLHVVTFRPADHPIRLRSRFPFRCRHHHHRHNRFFMPMRQHHEIPYGDDMILSRGENADFDQGMFQGGIRQIPARWVKIHHHHHHADKDDQDGDGVSKLMLKHNDVFDKDKFKMHKHHHFHHHEDNEEDNEERFKEHKERKEKSGGFFKRIRKILDHF